MEKKLPNITHYVWEEDGHLCSSWKVKAGNLTLNCGDGGMKLLQEAFQKEGIKLLKEYEDKFGNAL